MIRNIIAVIAGLVVANLVNMGLITLGHAVVALPPGSDVSTMEGLKAAMQSFGPEQFIFPFLAHAIGTLTGAFVAALIAASHKFKIAMVIGVVSLLGGIVAGIYLQAPLWFSAIDFVLAYIRWRGSERSLVEPGECNDVPALDEYDAMIYVTKARSGAHRTASAQAAMSVG